MRSWSDEGGAVNGPCCPGTLLLCMSDLPETTLEGYPKNNPAFDEAARKPLEARASSADVPEGRPASCARRLGKPAGLIARR